MLHLMFYLCCVCVCVSSEILSSSFCVTSSCFACKEWLASSSDSVLTDICNELLSSASDVLCLIHVVLYVCDVCAVRVSYAVRV